MNIRYFLPLLLSCLSLYGRAQDLSVPQSILDELTTEIVSSPNGVPTTFRVVYPKGYEANKKYPVLLGLSGGGQSKAVVDYCYAAWFRSPQFANYITVMPVNTKGGTLLDYTEKDIADMYEAIKIFFSVKSKDWVLAGTSNGGNAAFNFLAVNPGLFEGVVVVPGSLGNQEITTEWKHLKLLLVYGTDDAQDWIDAVHRTEESLNGKVKGIQVMELKGQGHFLPIDYDLEPVYKAYFNLR